MLVRNSLQKTHFWTRLLLLRWGWGGGGQEERRWEGQEKRGVGDGRISTEGIK